MAQSLLRHGSLVGAPEVTHTSAHQPLRLWPGASAHGFLASETRILNWPLAHRSRHCSFIGPRSHNSSSSADGWQTPEQP